MKTKRVLFGSAILLSAYSCMVSLGVGNSNSTTVQTSTELSAHLISATQAKVLSDEYTNKNYRIISASKRKPETKEVYYDINVLEDYIKYVKTESKKQGLKNVGITITFGQYPDNGNFDSRLNKDYQGQQTVYLKAASSISGVEKVGKGGGTFTSLSPEIPNIQAFDFGNLTPPER